MKRNDALGLLDRLVLNFERGEITFDEVVQRLPDDAFLSLVRPRLVVSAEHRQTLLEIGCPLSQGVASGRVCRSVAEVAATDASNGPLVLVCEKLKAAEIAILDQVAGVVTRREDSSSHGSIVARVNGVPLVNARNHIDSDFVSVNGFSGEIWRGRMQIESPKLDGSVGRFIHVMAQSSSLSIRANADTARDVRAGALYQAAGYEPRIEHMLPKASGLLSLRAGLLSSADELPDHFVSLKALLQREVMEVMREANAHPVHIRLLDPPAHEFLPPDDAGVERFAKSVGLDLHLVRDRISLLREENPMSGLRGARLLIERPDLLELQAEAIFDAALALEDEIGEEVTACITIPMVVAVSEVRVIRESLARCANRADGRRATFRLGVMIETPRAVFCAAELAMEADYLSFGTNDLTAQVFCMSRGDCYERYLSSYLQRDLLALDPFRTLDPSVMELVSRCVQDARSARPSIEIGLCGEQASDLDSLRFCLEVGLDSVAVSPNLIPETLFRAMQLSLGERWDQSV